MVEQGAPNRCLYIIGAQSTGKTTLANAFEDFYRDKSVRSEAATPTAPTVIREVARKVFKEKGYVREDITASPARALEIQKNILAAQLKSENSAINHAPPSGWYISDRSGLDPIVYAHLFVSEEAATEMLNTEGWRELRKYMKAGVVLLCEAGCRWLVDDGMRMMPEGREQWMKIDGAFRELLDREGISYSVVSKDMESIAERVEFVQEQLKRKN
ncbi:hypothetical protein DM02DRAFT_534144 [Periconia macrospinosa]|uniref:NadR/Ttd14 AAA domain-containing protein n=1 Tax=Periconia macrospinosa TaxID=97972 RepID=A0A2V1DG11_9PLEO|nr:hypothetical protein DM02DRAFT_534144 [Periconia macrospinosa]